MKHIYGIREGLTVTMSSKLRTCDYVFTFMLLGMSPIGNFIAGGSAHLIGTPLTVGIGGFICLLSVIILGEMARSASSLQEKVTTK